jgi:hypothetical protein
LSIVTLNLIEISAPTAEIGSIHGKRQVRSQYFYAIKVCVLIMQAKNNCVEVRSATKKEAQGLSFEKMSAQK